MYGVQTDLIHNEMSVIISDVIPLTWVQTDLIHNEMGY